MKDIPRMTGIIYDADKVSSGDAPFGIDPNSSDEKSMLDKVNALLTARVKKNGGVLFSTEIDEVFDEVFGFDGYYTSASSTPSPEKKYRLAIEDNSVAKKVRLDQLQPGSMFDWLGNPMMVVVDRLGNRRFVDLRAGYFQEFGDEHTLVRPLEATLTVNK